MRTKRHYMQSLKLQKVRRVYKERFYLTKPLRISDLDWTVDDSKILSFLQKAPLVII